MDYQFGREGDVLMVNGRAPSRNDGCARADHRVRACSTHESHRYLGSHSTRP